MPAKDAGQLLLYVDDLEVYAASETNHYVATELL